MFENKIKILIKELVEYFSTHKNYSAFSIFMNKFALHVESPLFDAEMPSYPSLPYVRGTKDGFFNFYPSLDSCSINDLRLLSALIALTCELPQIGHDLLSSTSVRVSIL